MIGFYKSLPSTWPLSGWCYFDHLTIFFAQDTGPLLISRNVFPINFSRIRVKKLWLCDQRDRRRIHLACSREAECSLEWIKYPTRQPVKHSTFPGCFTAHLNYVHWISFLKKRWNYLYKIRVDRGFYKLWKELPITIIFFFDHSSSRGLVASQVAKAPAVRWSSCKIRVTAKLYECVWKYLRPLKGIKNTLKFSIKNTSPYFHSASLAFWPLTMLKRTHFGELSIS